ncbi:MAG: peptidoglycan-binding protein [Blastocatellia bacterium]|nr:peptidoglycan-binding protein [Blastocatellia bacterium]
MIRFFRFTRNWLAAFAIALLLAASMPEFFSDEAFARPRNRRAGKASKSSRRSSKASRSRHNRGSKASRSRAGRHGRRAYGRKARGRHHRGRHSSYAAPAAPRTPPRAQIPEERVSEIQQALKKTGFYQGEVTGTYDTATREAMSSYQRANGLKETGMPTAQALMKLGLTKKTSPAGDTSAPGVTPNQPEKPNQ